MNDKKRKTTSQNSILKPIEESKKTTKKVNARKEYIAKYLKKHPEVTRMSFEEECVGQSKFREWVKKEKSEFVNKYLKKYKDAQAEYRRLEKEFLMGKLKIEDARKYPGWPCEMSPTYCCGD